MDRIGVVKALLQSKGININLEDKDNNTPINLAILREKEEIALLFLEKKQIDLNKGRGFSGSTLHLAVNKLMVSVVKRLLL